MMRWIATSLLLFVLALSVGCSSYSRARYCNDSGDCLAGETCRSNYCSGGSSNSSQCPDACLGTNSLPLVSGKRSASWPKRTRKTKVVYFESVKKATALARLRTLTVTQKAILRKLFLDKKDRDPRLAPVRTLLAKTPHLRQFLQSRLAKLDARTNILKIQASPLLDLYFAPSLKTKEYFDRPEGQCIPYLQLRADRILVHEIDDLAGNDEIYCIFQAVSDEESQYLVTPIVSAGNGETASFPENKSWFWGKDGVMYYPGEFLTVHIQCVEDDSDSRQYGKVLEEINKYIGAAEFLLQATPYGGTLKTIKLIIDVVSSLLGANDDDFLFEAKIEVDEDNLPEFANHDIEIRKGGTVPCSYVAGIPVGSCNWDWSLFIHSNYCRE